MEGKLRVDAPSFENVVEQVYSVRARMRPYDFNTRLEHFAYAWLENHHELINLSRVQAERAHLTDHGFGQLCSRVAPSKKFAAYMRACPPKLRVLKLNHWFHQGDGGTRGCIEKSSTGKRRQGSVDDHHR